MVNTAADNELQSEDKTTVVTLRDGNTRSFLSLAEAMLWCWDKGTDKVDHLNIDGAEDVEVWDIFRAPK